MKIKTIYICAKCSDAFHMIAMDKGGKEVGAMEEHSYVPDWMPGMHFGDYVELEIEVETGRIVNWTFPSQKQLQKTLK